MTNCCYYLSSEQRSKAKSSSGAKGLTLHCLFKIFHFICLIVNVICPRVNFLKIFIRDISICSVKTNACFSYGLIKIAPSALLCPVGGAMSLFKARDWWSAALGEGEEFDQGCLCVGDVDNSGTGHGQFVMMILSLQHADLNVYFC